MLLVMGCTGKKALAVSWRTQYTLRRLINWKRNLQRDVKQLVSLLCSGLFLDIHRVSCIL